MRKRRASCNHGCIRKVSVDEIVARGAAYADARKKLGDEAGFIAEIAKHWATDPKYAEKLMAVLSQVKGMLK
jgi:flagellum-specific peptidoglycan hydrolase FlgJ